jgi:hypothetical protein
LSDSAPFTTLESEDDDLGDLLLEVLPGDGGTIGNLSAREALHLIQGLASHHQHVPINWSATG